jgi:hypothetical protein
MISGITMVDLSLRWDDVLKDDAFKNPSSQRTLRSK